MLGVLLSRICYVGGLMCQPLLINKYSHASSVLYNINQTASAALAHINRYRVHISTLWLQRLHGN